MIRKIRDYEINIMGEYFDNALKSKEDTKYALEYFKMLQWKYNLAKDETINTRTGRIVKIKK